MQNKKRKYGDAWKNAVADRVEVEQMNQIFDRFVASPPIALPEQPLESIPVAETPIDHIDNSSEPIDLKNIPKDRNADLIDLNRDRDQRDQPSTKVYQNLVPTELGSGNQVPIEPSSNRAKLDLSTNTGFYTIPNALHDELLPTLPPYEQLVLLRLYRLSYGFNKTKTSAVSYSKLASKCNLSVSTVKRALQGLEAKKLINLIGDTKHNPTAGNQYELLLGQNLLVPIEPGSIGTKFSQTSIIDDHDDPLKIQDHHLRGTMMIYQKLTENVWSKSDQTTYQKIKHISLEVIEQAIRLAMQRSASRPNSLAYFVKEIRALANPSQESKAQKKKKLEKIVAQIKELNVGRGGYRISRLAEDVKQACARENVPFDNDLFNELIGISK